MRDVYVNVADKIAQLTGTPTPTIVAGNNDYTFHFTFDSEWEQYTTKTVRFAWKDKTTGQSQYRDRIMTGDSVMAPAVHNTNLIFVGVYAGDIRTSTPAVLVCFGAITDDAPYHDDPNTDLYLQLIDLLEEGGGGGTPEISPETLCFLPTSVPLDPDILDINDSDWQPCGKACSINWSNDSGGTGNFNVNPPMNALGVLIFAGVYYDVLHETIGYPTDDGWTLAHDPSIFAYPLDVPDYHYGIKVYTKMLDAGSQNIGFKAYKSEGGSVYSGYASCALFCFYNASSIALSEDTLTDDEYNPPLSTGNQRVYLLFQNSISGMSWEVLNYNAGGEEMTNFTQSNGNGVLYGWQDYLPEYYQTPKFKYVGDGEHFPDANSAVGITIDVLW